MRAREKSKELHLRICLCHIVLSRPSLSPHRERQQNPTCTQRQEKSRHCIDGARNHFLRNAQAILCDAYESISTPIWLKNSFVLPESPAIRSQYCLKRNMLSARMCSYEMCHVMPCGGYPNFHWRKESLGEQACPEVCRMSSLFSGFAC